MVQFEGYVSPLQFSFHLTIRSAMQQIRHTLIQHRGQQRNDDALDQIERQGHQQDKGQLVLHQRQDRTSHADDHVHRQSVEI